MTVHCRSLCGLALAVAFLTAPSCRAAELVEAAAKDEIVKDWMLQDCGHQTGKCFTSGENAEVEVRMIKAVLEELTPGAARPLRSDMDSLLHEKTPGSDPRVFSKAIGGASQDHWFMVSSSRVGADKVWRFRLKTDGDTGELKADTATGQIDLDVWAHIAAVWDGATMRLYKNGVEVGSLDKGGVLRFSHERLGFTYSHAEPAVFAGIGIDGYR